jgi:hypothetical protein
MAEAAPAVPRARSLEELTARGDASKPRSFRPTEVAPDLYIGAAPDVSDVAKLCAATGVRLVVCSNAAADVSRAVVLSCADGTALAGSNGAELADCIPAVAIAALDAAGPGAVLRWNIAATDSVQYNLAQHFEEACELLDAVWDRRGLPVVVHCVAGMSRSPALVAAALLRHCAGPPTVPAVLAALQRRRTVARPNPAFTQQLEAWAGLCAAQRSLGPAQD